jgi:hypothetical protein
MGEMGKKRGWSKKLIFSMRGLCDERSPNSVIIRRIASLSILWRGGRLRHCATWGAGQ